MEKDPMPDWKLCRPDYNASIFDIRPISSKTHTMNMICGLIGLFMGRSDTILCHIVHGLAKKSVAINRYGHKMFIKIK